MAPDDNLKGYFFNRGIVKVLYKLVSTVTISTMSYIHYSAILCVHILRKV